MEVGRRVKNRFIVGWTLRGVLCRGRAWKRVWSCKACRWQKLKRAGIGRAELDATLLKGVNRRLEFELGAWFEGACGFALVLALSQMREHGLGPFGRADLHPRRNPLDRQGRFAPQPGRDGPKDEG